MIVIVIWKLSESVVDIRFEIFKFQVLIIQSSLVKISSIEFLNFDTIIW